VKITLEREEVLACIIALERKGALKRIGEWGKSALAKLDTALSHSVKSKLPTPPH